jgi:hypothetical protein
MSAPPAVAVTSARPRRRRPAGRADAPGARRAASERKRARLLARYTPPGGDLREVVAFDGAEGCVLVVDRDLLTRYDARVVAHLAADEPPENAVLASALFARHASEELVRCRPLVPEDFAEMPAECSLGDELSVFEPRFDRHLRDAAGRTYRLEAIASALSIPELRWRRYPDPAAVAPELPLSVSVREAIAGLEAYEPVRTLTRLAISHDARRGEVSVAALRLELQRVARSPIVLNRKLRDTVLRLVAVQDLSMSEIAIRCGRVKRDAGGNISGETSWLGRRLGLLPEGGRERITPWIHTDVLALIARRGLGVSPREVESD